MGDGLGFGVVDGEGDGDGVAECVGVGYDVGWYGGAAGSESCGVFGCNASASGEGFAPPATQAAHVMFQSDMPGSDVSGAAPEL